MQNKKIRYVIIGIIGVVLLGLLVYVGTTVYPKFKIGKEISNLLSSVLTEENQAMHMKVATDFDGESFLLDSDIYILKEEEEKYLVLEQMNFPVYIVDSLLLLENGNAFKLSEEVSKPEYQYDDLFVQIAAAYEIFDITCVKADYESVYSINVTGEQVQELLSMAVPMDNAQIENIEKLQLKLVAQNDRLDRIEMMGSAKLSGKSVQVEVVISEFQKMDEGAYKIPEAVKQAVKTVDRDTLFHLTEDLYRLLAAFEQFQKKETQEGTVTLHANYGVINFTNTFDLALFQQEENSSVDTEEIKNLPAMMAALCVEGEIRCVERTDGFEYSLSLDEESMQKITGMVIPEMVNYVIHLTDGIAKIDVVDNTIASIEISVKGDMNILITKVPMEVAVKFQYE